MLAMDAEQWMHSEKYGEDGNVLSPGKRTEFLGRKRVVMSDADDPEDGCYHNDVIIILFIGLNAYHDTIETGQTPG